MYKKELSVRGTRVAELPGVLYEELEWEGKGDVERYEGDGFDVIVVEGYALRTNSDQQATIVFDSVDDNTSKATILSGGGGGGLLRMNLGSHEKQAEDLARLIERLGSGELQLEVID